MTATCPACPAPQTDGILCNRCHGRLEQQVAEMPGLIDALADVLAKLTVIDEQVGVRNDPRAGQPLPINLSAIAPRHEVHARLFSWVKLVVEERYAALVRGPRCRSCLHPSCAYVRRQRGPRNDAAAMAVWLVYELHWLRVHPAVGEFCDEMGALFRRLQAAVDLPKGRRFPLPDAPCLRQDEAGDPCPGVLWAWLPRRDEDPAMVWCSVSPTAHRWLSDEFRRMGLVVVARRESKVVVA